MNSFSVLVVTMMLSAPALALTGFLKTQHTVGQWKYCYYTDGRILTVQSHKICPLQIDWSRK